MSPKVSVIIPTYNSENFLDRAIQSVLNQTFKDWELIIVDDCSTDHTREVIKKWEEKDKRIRSYFLPENSGGPAKPFNTGIKNSSGEFIAFLEADDEWLSEKLEKQLRIFEKFKKVGLVTCWVKRIFENTWKVFNPYTGVFFSKEWKIFWAKGVIKSLSTVIIKRELIKEIGGFDENLKASADIDFYMRAIKKYDFFYLPEILVNYYETPNSLGRAKDAHEKSVKELKYIIKKHQNDLDKNLQLKNVYLRKLATFYLLSGKKEHAKLYIKQALSSEPFNLRLWIHYFLIHSKCIFKKILAIKNKFF